jgi:hypothetical protein
MITIPQTRSGSSHLASPPTATLRSHHMLTILLSHNSTRSTPMRCIASAHLSRATHTNLLTSPRLNGQALSRQFLKLRRTPPSFTAFPRTYVCAFCECSCPALVPRLKHYSPGERILVRGVGCSISMRAPASMIRMLGLSLAPYRLYRSTYYSLPS